MRTLQLSIIILATNFFFNTDSIAQQQIKEPAIGNLNLTVSKLIIGNNDITDSLGIVKIANNLWVEYNRKDVEIGRANIIKNTGKEMQIKWISATNGAKKDAVTIYKINKDQSTYTFDIYFDNKKQGYFVASTE
ncbi:MAG TPA: hypothetical protein PKL31_10660 [Fulvivirga sp.]|nr:hypothetical protein [Fulvivirga sp.]